MRQFRAGIGSGSVTALALGLTLSMMSPAGAHEDPSGCFETAAAIIVTIFRADGVTSVIGTVSECETIRYQATLQKAQDLDSICAFSGGTFRLTTPDGVVHDISLNVPCIGGNSGLEGCAPTTDAIQSVQIPYTVNPADVVGGLITGTATYSGGVAHDSPNNTAGVAAITPKSTPVVFCNDENNCTIDTCDPAGQGSAACRNTPLVCDDQNGCTRDACDPATGLCVFTPVPGCTTTIPTTTSLAPTTTTTTLPDPCASPHVDPSTCVRHFQCFELKPGTPQVTLPNVTLRNRFGQLTVGLRLPDRICAPANKRGEDPTAPADPEHLMAYPVLPRPVVAMRNLVLSDQFGTTVLDTVSLRKLLVPAAKSLTAPPAPLPAPIRTDHFACYKVRPSRGLGTTARFRRVLGVQVQDQFGMRVVDVIKPALLCVPTDKNGEAPAAPTHAALLQCYRTRPSGTPFSAVSPIFTTDQLHGWITRAIRTQELCVPSRLGIPGSTTSTTAPSTTSTLGLPSTTSSTSMASSTSSTTTTTTSASTSTTVATCTIAQTCCTCSNGVQTCATNFCPGPTLSCPDAIALAAQFCIANGVGTGDCPTATCRDNCTGQPCQ